MKLKHDKRKKHKVALDSSASRVSLVRFPNPLLFGKSGGDPV